MNKVSDVTTNRPFLSISQRFLYQLCPTMKKQSLVSNPPCIPVQYYNCLLSKLASPIGPNFFRPLSKHPTPFRDGQSASPNTSILEGLAVFGDHHCPQSSSNLKVTPLMRYQLPQTCTPVMAAIKFVQKISCRGYSQQKVGALNKPINEDITIVFRKVLWSEFNWCNMQQIYRISMRVYFKDFIGVKRIVSL